MSENNNNDQKTCVWKKNVPLKSYNTSVKHIIQVVT